MTEVMDPWSAAVLLGTIATAVMDLGSLLLARVAGIPVPNYALVGRWIAHMRSGRFHHDAIAAAAAMPGERVIGWSAHYLIGIAFAALLLALWGPGWTQQPTLAPALIVGFGTLAAPFFLMQPAMGAGIAGSRTPRPWVARLRSAVNHGLFGLGLYAAGALMRLLSAA